MSLITLRSVQQDNGANTSQSASNFTNHFKDPIVLGPGNTIELVSMSIIKLDRYEIILGQNDTFIWRIGAGASTLGGTPLYSQHVVVLVPGSYNGADLALHIAEQLNSSTLLGLYRGTWTCVFSSETSDSNAKFTINYAQNPTPAENGENTTWIQKYGAGNPYTLSAVQTPFSSQKLEFTPTAMGTGSGTGDGYGFHSDRGIFSNGGQTSQIIEPVSLLDEITTLDSQDNQILNFGTTTQTVKTIFTKPVLPNNWEYQVECFNGPIGNIRTVDIQGQLGRIVNLHTFNGGSGYNIGDLGNCVDQGTGIGSGATYEVLTISGGGGITSVQILDPGQGYLLGDDLFLIATTGGGSGTEAKVLSIETGNEGTAYAVNDVGSFTGGSGNGATYKITSIGAGGSITGIEITDGGNGYLQGEVLVCEGNGNDDGLVRITLVDRRSFLKYAYVEEKGLLGIGNFKNVSALNPVNWDFVVLKLNGNTPAPAFHRMSEVGGNMELETTLGGGFQFSVKKTYPKSIIGYARQQLVNGDFGDSNAVYNNNEDGMDCQIMMESGDNDDIYFNVYQLDKQPGRNYPVAGWRDVKIITTNLLPDGWSGMPSAPNNWLNFNFGTDNVKITMEIDANRNIICSASHDSAQDGVFTELQTWLKTGDKESNSNGLMTNDFNTTIRESLYPLHAITFTGSGTAFTSQTKYLGGIMDTEIITQEGKDLRSINGLPHTLTSVHEEVDLDVSASNLTLSAIYKMGLITGTDIHYGPPSGASPNQISDRDLSPNISNSNFLLGLRAGYTFQSGQISNAIQTADDNKPLPSLSEPTLHVELPDFNIKSWSGQSSDTGRAIAVIPKEQWTTDETTGVLHYMSQYPIQIDLNIQAPRPFYEINCRLRSPDGKIADDLLNPTEICLKIGETEESRQTRIMTNAMAQLGQVISNRQDQKISTMTDNMPLL